MPTLVESPIEFAHRHGEAIEIGGELFYPDGATSDRSGMLRREPPDDPVALLRNRRTWVQAKLAEEEAEFWKFKNESIEQDRRALDSPNLPEAQNVVPQLVSGKKRIRELREELARLDAEWAETPNERAKRQRALNEQERRERIAANIKEIEAINLE